MWPCSVVLSILLLYARVYGDNSKVFDVTTVLDISQLHENYTSGVTGRVHSRTNALGLPLFNGYKLLKYTSVKPNLTCDTVEGVCSWTHEGWDLTPVSLPNYKSYAEINNGQFIRFTDSLILYAEQSLRDNMDLFSPQNYLNLEFTSGKEISCTQHHQLVVSITIEMRLKVKHRFCGCDINGEYVGRIPDVYWRDLYCSRTYDEYNPLSSYLVVRTKGSELSLEENGVTVKRWVTPKNINYFKVKNDVPKSIKLAYKGETGLAYSSSSASSEMVSPVITVDEGKLCLVLVIYIPTTTKGTLLDIFSEDFTTERNLLYSLKKPLPIGWNVEHININFPSRTPNPVKLVIKKTSETSFKIARIASCSPYGNEVEIIPSVDLEPAKLSHLPLDKNYTVTAHAIEPAEQLARNVSVPAPVCENSGVWTTAGCACPPGFYGNNCQSGCGRNRFGQDCGGLCSLRKKECQGLLMCTYSTGCQCAPGYGGKNCLEKCSEGFYGNNCQHKCGHCAAGAACDIYNGECPICEFGYLPPRCTKESVYYFLPPQLSSPDHGVITVTFDPKKNKSHNGSPVLYQVQVKEQGHDWITITSKKFPELNSDVSGQLTVVEKVEGVRDGVLYKVRVLLLDNNFNKYDGELVGISEIITKCDIPEEYSYSLAYESNTSSLSFIWSYNKPVNSHWCPVEQYEVSWKEDWQWLTTYTNETQYLFTDLLPGSTIQFKVRASTSGGFAPYSETVIASTQLAGLPPVRNLNIGAKKGSSAEVSWEPPMESGNKPLRYFISYKCVDRPACSPGCETASEGQLTVQDTRITLSPLLPFTQYQVTVAPENGQSASVYVGTTDVVPTEVPAVSDRGPVRTNTSLTVFWEEVPVCSGFLLGYNYQLTKESEDLKILESGFTNNNSATFQNLTASTRYVVKVFISTIAGWNPDMYLAINASTSATVPEAVMNLTVYKRGRGMLGLRWAEPRATYGQLKSFTVSHSLGQDVTSHTVEPTRCVAWPELYCHTIEGLRSNRRYNVSVSARNSEVAEDGEVVYISAITKESPPSAPVNLKVSNISTTTIELEWDYPEMANGIVRSFLIGVEETEKYDQDTCCQIYPFVETLVKEESKTYRAEVSGLHPASTYFVSVSAKTVGLGPSQSLVVSTRPPHLRITSLPRILQPDVSWLPQDALPEVNNSDIYTSLIRAHLLMAVLNDNQSVQLASESGLTDPKLESLLRQRIKVPFYFISEYNQDDDVDLDDIPEDTDSPWGRPPALSLEATTYQLVAVQVSEYNSIYNVDLCFSNSLTLFD